jgi:hypothetical protein
MKLFRCPVILLFLAAPVDLGRVRVRAKQRRASRAADVQPISPQRPQYNPATGSAPAGRGTGR